MLRSLEAFRIFFSNLLPDHHRQSFHMKSVGKQIDGLDQREFVAVACQSG